MQPSHRKGNSWCSSRAWRSQRRRKGPARAQVGMSSVEDMKKKDFEESARKEGGRMGKSEHLEEGH